MSIEKIFKSHILNSGGYKGGMSKVEDNDSQNEIFKLSSNENMLGSVPSALQIIKKRAQTLNIYPSGTPQPLYEALASHYHQASLTDHHFIAANGGSELLQLITRAFLSESSNYIISNPCFAPYQMFSSWTGAKVKDIRLREPDFTLDVSGILNAIDEHTRLIFLTSPNNPTGTYIKKRALEELLDNIPDHVVIIYDEVYHHFADAPDYTRAIPYVLEGYPIIAINSFSKAYGLAGLRIGYGYSTPEISAYIRKLIRPFLINDISMNTAIAALNDDDFLRSTIINNQQQRAILTSGLNKLGIKHWKSQGNFILVNTDLEADLLTDKMLKNHVMVRSATNFGAPGCIRITIGNQTATQSTLEALATIFG